MNYPPIDPDFYAVGVESGMSDADIEADWKVYCDDLQKFHAEINQFGAEMTPEVRETLKDELDKIQEEISAGPLPVQHGMQPFLDDLKKLLGLKQ